MLNKNISGAEAARLQRGPDRGNTPYEIFRADPRKGIFRLGSVTGRERAIDLSNRLAARTPGGYFVLDKTTGELMSIITTAPGINAAQVRP